MTAVVVDASAIGALLFGEPERHAIADQLRGCELHAPSIIAFEVASIATKKVRRRQLSKESALDALAAFAAMDIKVETIAADSCLTLALSTGLSAYDAAYLALARELQSPLVTLDARLKKAAQEI